MASFTAPLTRKHFTNPNSSPAALGGACAYRRRAGALGAALLGGAAADAGGDHAGEGGAGQDGGGPRGGRQPGGGGQGAEDARRGDEGPGALRGPHPLPPGKGGMCFMGTSSTTSR